MTSRGPARTPVFTEGLDRHGGRFRSAGGERNWGSCFGILFLVDDKSGSGAVLAVVSAMVLQHEDFGFLAGIAIFVVCLSLNQIAYLIGTTLVHRAAKKRYAHKDIAHEYKR